MSASLQGGASADDLADSALAVGLRRLLLADRSIPIVLAMADLRKAGFTAVRLVLPAPGDAVGLPGPAALNRRALAAGAVIVGINGADPDQGLAIIPSDDGEWACTGVALGPAVRACWPTVRHARSEFAQAVAGHAAALTELDVAADAHGLRQSVLGEDHLPLPPLPPGIDHDRRELLGRARLVAVLAATAIHDDGAAVSAAEASSRSAHLRALAAVARRAIAASVSGP